MKKIKSLMKLYEMTQFDLAQRLNLSYRSTNLKLNGKRQFTQNELISLSELFNCSIDELLERKEK